MKNELQQNNSSLVFQKYPKNYVDNQHYKSVKEKMLTSEEEQEVIKFPFSEYGKNANFYKEQNCQSGFKIQKWKGKKYQTIPMRTISYSAPSSYEKISQLQKCTPLPLKANTTQNKFTSKFLHTNMKRLKDMRKNNYKNTYNSNEKQPKKKKNQFDNELQLKLDLFRITSTNFTYEKQKNVEENNFSQALRHNSERTGKRNVIKFKKQNQTQRKQNIDKSNEHILETSNEKENPTMQNRYFLESIETTKQTQNQNSPIKDQQKIVEISRQKSRKLMQDKSKPTKMQIFQPQMSEQHKKSKQDIETQKNFIRYSQEIMLRQYLRGSYEKGKSQNNGTNKGDQTETDEHVNSSFKTSFRIKHIQDNKNILMTTLKRKSRSLSKNELVQFIYKVIT